VLNTVEWKDIYSAMPAGKPYGYLILEASEGQQVFKLVKDYSIIGRSHESDIVIPERYGRVSKQHCAIRRNMDGIEVTDVGSSNGTYLNQHAVSRTNLHHGDVLYLGDGTAKEKVCALKFELWEQASLKPRATEHGT
jgi:pSer/pThr/pTyr-binding forkhead associated (FHA) protein